MAERCVPQGFVSAQSSAYPQIGQGIYVGKVPGSSNAPPYIDATSGYSGAGAVATQAGLTIQTDSGFISTLGAQPQNVLRITGASGVGYIQGTNIGFAVPYSGAAGVRILPSTNQINVNNISFVSTLGALNTGGSGLVGTVNMTQLVSSIKGYGWAQVI